MMESIFFVLALLKVPVVVVSLWHCRHAVTMTASVDRLYDLPSFTQVYVKVCTTGLSGETVFNRCKFPVFTTIVSSN